MKRFSTFAIFTAAVIISAAGFTIAQQVVPTKSAPAPAAGAFRSISRAEVEMLIADVTESNPAAIEKFADPEMRKGQLEDLKQLLAFATAAQKEGIADDPTSRVELANIRSEVLAVSYDRERNKGKTTPGQFSTVSPDQIKAFWIKNPTAAEAAFDDFLEAKLKLMPAMAARQITEPEKEQARDFFAKLKISERNYLTAAAAGKISPAMRARFELHVRLQQAQFLARRLGEKLAQRSKVSEADIDKYISGRPEFAVEGKRAKAASILVRARAGEDFAKLADEFSEDPGNWGNGGKKNGGIYRDVPMGRMIPAFEKAALALEPGAVFPEMVETDFGFHIIKLERKGKIAAASDETYDVRHILISTTLNDPLLPGRPLPLRNHVRSLLEKEKEKTVIDAIVAAHSVSVPEDFSAPGAIKAARPVVKKNVPVRKKRPAARSRKLR